MTSCGIKHEDIVSFVHNLMNIDEEVSFREHIKNCESCQRKIEHEVELLNLMINALFYGSGRSPAFNTFHEKVFAEISNGIKGDAFKEAFDDAFQEFQHTVTDELSEKDFYNFLDIILNKVIYHLNNLQLNDAFSLLDKATELIPSIKSISVLLNYLKWAHSRVAEFETALFIAISAFPDIEDNQLLKLLDLLRALREAYPRHVNKDLPDDLIDLITKWTFQLTQVEYLEEVHPLLEFAQMENKTASSFVDPSEEVALLFNGNEELRFTTPELHYISPTSSEPEGPIDIKKSQHFEIKLFYEFHKIKIEIKIRE